jgi:hypothetical protein
MDSQPKEQGLLEASFLKEVGSHTLFQSAQEGRASAGGPV